MDIRASAIIIILSLILFIVFSLKEIDLAAAGIKLIVLTVAFLGDFSNLLGLNGLKQTQTVSFMVIVAIYTLEMLEIALDMFKESRKDSTN